MGRKAVNFEQKLECIELTAMRLYFMSSETSVKNKNTEIIELFLNYDLHVVNLYY